MAVKNFEVREAKFYPYGKYKINQGTDTNTGDTKLTGSVMQVGSGSFNLDINVQYTKDQGAGALKVTQVGGNRVRFEFPTESEELKTKFPLNTQISIDHRSYWFNYDGFVRYVDEKVIEVDVFTAEGGGATEGYFDGEVIVRQFSEIRSVEIKYNVSPDDSNTFLNNLDGGTQILTANGLDRTGNNKTLNVKTGSVRNWEVSEYSPQAKTLSFVSDYQVNARFSDQLVRQRLRLSGIPYILPYWREDMVDNYNDKLIPEEYQGDRTLKFVAEVKLWFYDDQRNDPLIYNFEVDGDVGYYGEDANGKETGINSTSVSYTNVTQAKTEESFDLKDSNLAVINLGRSFGSFKNTDLISVYIGKKSDLEEYDQSVSNFATTYLYSIISNVADNISRNVDKLGRGELSNLKAQVTGSGQGLKIDVYYDTFSTTTLRLEEGDEYILSVSVYDPTTGELTQLLIDDPQYSQYTDEANLIRLIKGRGFDPDADFTDPLDNGFSSLSSWNEDGLIVGFQLRQFSAEFGIIESAKMKLLGTRRGAQDGTTNFNDPEDFVIIQEFDVPINEIGTTSDGIQIFDEKNLQPFNLRDSNPFNWILTRSLQGVGFVDQFFSMAFKINWQYWNSLNNVPNVFLNQSDAFNGFNERSSNYSEKPIGAVSNDIFDTKAVLFVTCKNRNNSYSTEYALQFPLITYDYGEDIHTRTGISPDDFPDFTGSIITEKLDGTDLSGSILTGEPTKIRIHFTNNGRVSGAQDFYFFTRIEEAEQKGFDIWEMSNLILPEDNSPIVPLINEMALTVYPDGSGGWWLECQTDPTKLKEGTGYKLSGRMGLNEDGGGLGYGFSVGFTIGFNS